jgi:hypothetical protein
MISWACLNFSKCVCDKQSRGWLANPGFVFFG